VEKEEALYVILDVESIFTEAAPAPAASAVRLSKPIEPQVKTSDQDLKFVCEGLASLVSFYVTPANEAWVRKRFAAWKKNRDKLGISVQLRGPEDAGEFLSGFASTDSGNLWGDAQRAALIDLLLPHPSGTFVVWNYGCGRGFDAYSAVCTLKSAFPALAVKAWANDDNLVEIATAPSLMLPKELVPAFYASSSFLRGTDAGFQFTPTVRESIIFEYTESLSRMEIIQADLIICRDVVSYLPPDAQKTLLEAFAERLTPDGRLILGTNELAAGAGWKATEKGGARAFVRESPKE
jgi:purine-binding chemotaxis protein CheW